MQLFLSYYKFDFLIFTITNIPENRLNLLSIELKRDENIYFKIFLTPKITNIKLFKTSNSFNIMNSTFV